MRGENDAPSYDLTERAFALWRAGACRLERIQDPGRRAEYEGAIRFILALLSRFERFSQLVASYFPLAGEEHTHHEEIGGWVEYACRAINPERPLNRGIVEDTAYCRRAQDLVAAHIQRTT